MPTISVITPVYAGGETYLVEAYNSLREQEMPTNWKWQWVVQEDGLTGAPLELLPKDQRISTGVGRAGRASMARTMALARAEGDLVRMLDADDLLTEGALHREITVLAANPDIGWTAAAALDLHVDGHLTGVDTNPPGGRLKPGSVAESYRARRLSILGTTICARSALVMALGGWPALPSSEDVGLLLALEAVAPGWFISETCMLYRKYPGQSTSYPAHYALHEVAARRAVILERVSALRKLGWRMPSEVAAA
jgi:glycosyltransferase involved in cell wall biosynthesis